MQIGVRFPTMEIGADRSVIRDWTVAAGALGFSHIAVSDHVLGVDPAARPDYSRIFPDTNGRGPYVLDDAFHEPVVMIAYMSALCPEMEFTTGVLIAPQRQTVLMAKQAAQLDLLCGGRLRLSLGVGWNPIEYEALGADFHTRGRRLEEQFRIMRALWTQPTVNIKGEFDRVVGVGLAPNSVQRPIPLWIGGYSTRVLDRIGRIADGWHAGNYLPDDMAERLATIARAAESADRPPSDIGLEGSVDLQDGLDTIVARVERWKQVGATHLLINPMLGGHTGAQHITVLDRIASALPLRS